jgi:cytochrome oxidase assembly protein ShyY1
VALLYRQTVIKNDIVMAIKFRFRWIPFIAAVMAVALGLSLGNWQMRRAAQKEAIEQKLVSRQAAEPLTLRDAVVDIDEVEYRRIAVTGQFRKDWPVYLDNRPHKGVAGFHLLMPLKIDGSDQYVLVARGWFPRNPGDRYKLPAVPVPIGVVNIEGLAKRHAGHLLQLGEPAKIEPGAIVQNLDIAQFAKVSHLSLHPFIVEQTNDTQDGLIRNWDRPSSGVDKHWGYAFQWYGLAATAFIFFVVTGFRRGKHQAS